MNCNNYINTGHGGFFLAHPPKNHLSSLQGAIATWPSSLTLLKPIAKKLDSQVFLRKTQDDGFFAQSKPGSPRHLWWLVMTVLIAFAKAATWGARASAGGVI